MLEKTCFALQKLSYSHLRTLDNKRLSKNIKTNNMILLVTHFLLNYGTKLQNTFISDQIHQPPTILCSLNYQNSTLRDFVFLPAQNSALAKYL